MKQKRLVLFTCVYSLFCLIYLCVCLLLSLYISHFVLSSYVYVSFCLIYLCICPVLSHLPVRISHFACLWFVKSFKFHKAIVIHDSAAPSCSSSLYFRVSSSQSCTFCSFLELSLTVHDFYDRVHLSSRILALYIHLEYLICLNKEMITSSHLCLLFGIEISAVVAAGAGLML